MSDFSDAINAASRAYDAAVADLTAKLAVQTSRALSAESERDALKAKLDQQPAPATTPPPAPSTDDPVLPDKPTLVLGNGNTLSDGKITPGAKIYLKAGETIKLTRDAVNIKVDGVVIYTDRSNPATLVHPGGQQKCVCFQSSGSDTVLDGFKVDCSNPPTGKDAAVWIVRDNGRNTRVNRVTHTERVTRIFTGSEDVAREGPSIDAKITDCGDGVTILGGAFDSNESSIAGVYLGTGGHGAVITGNKIVSAEYCVRDNAGFSIIKGNEWGEGKDRNGKLNYRAGGVTVRPDDPDAITIVDSNTFNGGVLELGYDTAKCQYKSLIATSNTFKDTRFVQLVGADNDGASIVWRGNVGKDNISRHDSFVSHNPPNMGD